MTCLRPNVPRSNPKDVNELAEPLRSRIKAAIRDAPTKGLVLVSGYRDPGRQWDLRHERCRGRECNSACKGYPVTALPGQSNHQRRTAADMGGRDLQWLIDNRERYGLALTVRSENWHFEADRVDVRTGRMHNRPTASIGVHPVEPKPPAAPKEHLRLGSKGEDVRFLQQQLNKARRFTKHPAIAEDGIFGPATEAAVKAVQKWSNDFLDAIGDRTTSRVVVHGVVGPGTSEVILAWANA